MSDLVALALGVGDVVRANADAGERGRRLPQATLDVLVAAGLMRMCVPAVYDGPAADPVTVVRAIEALAHADGAAGWCSMIASTTSSMASFLPADAAQELYGDPDVVTGGVFAPNGAGHADGDAVVVTGRWAWGSGTQHCRWILGGAQIDDGTFRLCWFADGDVTFHDTWHTSGLRGTGSLDFSVDGARVPVERTVQPGVTLPVVDGPLAAFPNFGLLAAGVAAVNLGVGRRALDEVEELAGSKQPQFSSRSLARSGFTQIEISRAEARLRAGRAYLLDELAMAWARAEAGERIGLDTRRAIRAAALAAAEAGAHAADTAYTLAGGTSVYESSVLQRCFRDAHVATQHIMVAPKLHETLGKLWLGLEAETRNL
ncbi:MAG: hypothetical protein H0U21_04690 [Acidimicrobiia bacterium]|nr:hypothetical protein [Acidimicrobiia bacterium]